MRCFSTLFFCNRQLIKTQKKDSKNVAFQLTFCTYYIVEALIWDLFFLKSYLLRLPNLSWHYKEKPFLHYQWTLV